MAAPRPSRVSADKILRALRLAGQGDRAALALALDGMRTLAYSPRYWKKYLTLLRHPLARLVDLLTLKQGDRIAHQKGWKLGPRDEGKRRAPARPAPARRRRRPTPSPGGQASLFE